MNMMMSAAAASAASNKATGGKNDYKRYRKNQARINKRVNHGASVLKKTYKKKGLKGVIKRFHFKNII